MATKSRYRIRPRRRRLGTISPSGHPNTYVLFSKVLNTIACLCVYFFKIYLFDSHKSGLASLLFVTSHHARTRMKRFLLRTSVNEGAPQGVYSAMLRIAAVCGCSRRHDDGRQYWFTRAAAASITPTLTCPNGWSPQLVVGATALG